jgi:glycosyltransferase involved in cell wall biosynthesis
MSDRARLKIFVLADTRSFHTERYVCELRRQGHSVFLASLERGRMHQYTLKSRGFVKQLHYVLAGREALALARRIRPSIINPHFASGYGFLAAVAGLRRIAPVVTNLWGSDILLVPEKSRLHRRKTAFAIARSDWLIGDSEHLLRAARDIGPEKPASVIPWGIEERYLQYHRADYRLAKPLRIIVPRPHEPVYNNLFIVRALAPLLDEGAIELTFPEWGSLTENFKNQALSLTEGRVQLYPRMPRDRFMQFVAAHDVYLSSAVSDSSPASMIEAMGLGLLPVAADIPGVHEWLSADNGYLYERYNAQALRTIIGDLIIGNDDPRVDWRRANRERVKREAVFEQNVSTAAGIMRELAGGTP